MLAQTNQEREPLVHAHASTFEETYRTAYSHGLELIYALETVDIKTVRSIDDSKPSPEPATQIKTRDAQNIQLEFDYGSNFREWIDSFVQREPISVLGLSRHAEKCLIEQGRLLLSDLIAADLRKFVFIKGMGQGYIDEIRNKLSAYLEGRHLHSSKKVDFIAWIRSMLGLVDRRKAYAALESYGLAHLVNLSPSETTELRRLPLEQRHDWVQEILEYLRHEQRWQQFSTDLDQFVTAFVKPWMYRRQGLATQDELEERFEMVAEGSTSVPNILRFFRDTYCENKVLLQDYLYPVTQNLYAVDLQTAEKYFSLMRTVRSYFYKSQINYRLSELVQWVLQEHARRWEGFPEGFVEKALRYTLVFRVQKDSDGYSIVRFI